MIDRRTFLAGMLGAAGLGCCPAAFVRQEDSSATRPAARRPNIIVILADDQGCGDLGINGHDTAIATPRLDQLARTGARFTQGYACAGMCTPSRAGLLSGVHPARLGVYDVSGDAAYSFPREVRILPEMLHEAGYATGLIGKWHLGGEIDEWAWNHPLRRGFDRFWGFMGSTHDYFLADRGSGLNGGGYWDCGYQPLYDQHEPVEHIDYLTDAITRQAVHFIEANAQRPFFLYLAHHCPHVPLQVPRKSYEQFESLGLGANTHLTRAMYLHLDQGIGAVMDTLGRLGIADDTLILYASDNGGGEGSGQLNWHFRGGKFSLMEGGLRVPMLVHWPGHIPGGTVCDLPVTHLDFMPTILAAAGVGAPEQAQGSDLLPLLTGATPASAPRTLCWRMSPATGDGNFAVREGDWKLVRTSLGQGLFNLQDDPGETRDLSAQHPEVAAHLLERYTAWDITNIPSKFTPQHRRRYMDRRVSPNARENAIYSYSPTFGPDGGLT